MAKHTQTIRRQFADDLFECVWPFCGIGAWKVNKDMLSTKGLPVYRNKWPKNNIQSYYEKVFFIFFL